MWFPGRQISMQELQGWPASYLRGIYVVHWAGEDVDGAVSWQGTAAVNDVKWKEILQNKWWKNQSWNFNPRSLKTQTWVLNITSFFSRGRSLNRKQNIYLRQTVNSIRSKLLESINSSTLFQWCSQIRCLSLGRLFGSRNGVFFFQMASSDIAFWKRRMKSGIRWIQVNHVGMIMINSAVTCTSTHGFFPQCVGNYRKQNFHVASSWYDQNS